MLVAAASRFLSISFGLAEPGIAALHTRSARIVARRARAMRFRVVLRCFKRSVSVEALASARAIFLLASSADIAPISRTSPL